MEKGRQTWGRRGAEWEKQKWRKKKGGIIGACMHSNGVSVTQHGEVYV